MGDECEKIGYIASRLAAQERPVDKYREVKHLGRVVQTMVHDALDAFAIEGIRHNIPFLAALMEHPRWRAGKLSTGFIAEPRTSGRFPMWRARPALPSFLFS